MIYITDNNTIHLIRGDNAKLSLALNNYTPLATDSIQLCIKKNVNDTEKVLTVNAIGDDFNFNSNDTINLSFGKYLYDIKLTTKDNEIFTIIPCSEFYIEREVHN